MEVLPVLNTISVVVVVLYGIVLGWRHFDGIRLRIGINTGEKVGK